MPETVNRLLKGLLNGQMALIDDADHSAIISALFDKKGQKATQVPKASSLPAELASKFNWIIFGAPGTGKSTMLNDYIHFFGQTMNV